LKQKNKELTDDLKAMEQQRIQSEKRKPAAQPGSKPSQIPRIEQRQESRYAFATNQPTASKDEATYKSSKIPEEEAEYSGEERDYDQEVEADEA
jgi:hypothetical protein